MSNASRRMVHPHFVTRRLTSVLGAIGLFVMVLSLVPTLSPRVGVLPIPTARAQDNAHAVHAAEQIRVPLLDGSAQPQSIPDELAIRVLLETLRVPSVPDEEAVKKLHTRISRVSLSDDDFDILSRELGVLDAQAKIQQSRVDAVKPSNASDASQLERYLAERSSLDDLFVEQYDRILSSLSAQGVAKLEAHLLHVKSRIKVYPTPDMSATH